MLSSFTIKVYCQLKYPTINFNFWTIAKYTEVLKLIQTYIIMLGSVIRKINSIFVMSIYLMHNYVVTETPIILYVDIYVDWYKIITL